MHNIQPEVLAIHQAGHALMQAAEQPTPSEFFVHRLPGEESLPNQHETPAQCELRLLVYLAGIAAERAMGWEEHELLKQQDLGNWNFLASRFLANAPEILCRETLQNSQLERLRIFFRVNKWWLVQISQDLTRSATIDMRDVLLGCTIDFPHYLRIPRVSLAHHAR